jgi:hypothetical protein
MGCGFKVPFDFSPVLDLISWQHPDCFSFRQQRLLCAGRFTLLGACGLTLGGCGMRMLSRLGLGLIAAVLKNSRSK